jgi:hypothetical protein
VASALNLTNMFDAYKNKFTVVGMDTRGSGASEPVKCDPEAYAAVPLPVPNTEAEFELIKKTTRACVLARSLCSRGEGLV